MRYRIVLNIRHIGEVVDGKFSTHLKGMDNMLDYIRSWWDKPVRMSGSEQPMDWDDPVKVWYKLMGDLMQDTPLRAVPLDPPPANLPADAPRARETRFF